jgi:glycosyltransferase involved in cell wall biosynthesis
VRNVVLGMLYITDWKGYSGAKQYALEKVQGDWVFWLDADERVTTELATEISHLVKENSKFSGYRMPRKAYFLGRWMRHGGWYPGYVVRLFKRKHSRFNSARVHEGLVIEGNIGTLKGHLLHYTDDSIHYYFEKFNTYTTLAAKDLKERGKVSSFVNLLFRSIHMFVKMYILKRGFLDGMEGFVLAVFSATYVFTKYAKLWELEKKGDLK